MKKAIITDWLDKYGGAERVLTAICEVIEFDYHYAYVNRMSSHFRFLTFGNKNVEVIDSTIFKSVKNHFRYLMPLFPKLIKSFNKQTKNNKVDLVISSSWVLSKAYRIGNETHICYLQARNFKYVWEEAQMYFKGPRKLLLFIKKPLQRFDVKAAQNPDVLISNSIFVQKWVKEKYARDSLVVYPPVDTDDFFVSNEKQDYFICIGRMEPYKRFDIIVEAFNKNGKRLVMVGDGSMYRGLKRIAKPNINFVGYKEKHEIKHLLSEAKSFVYAGIEDFGIVLVEALASGTPVICFDGGAANEIIEDGSNGILYSVQNSESLNLAIERFETTKLKKNCLEIKRQSESFSKSRFQREFLEIIDSASSKLNLESNVLNEIN